MHKYRRLVASCDEVSRFLTLVLQERVSGELAASSTEEWSWVFIGEDKNGADERIFGRKCPLGT